MDEICQGHQKTLKKQQKAGFLAFGMQVYP